jgi:hypothetical protein
LSSRNGPGTGPAPAKMRGMARRHRRTGRNCLSYGFGAALLVLDGKIVLFFAATLSERGEPNGLRAGCGFNSVYSVVKEFKG